MKFSIHKKCPSVIKNINNHGQRISGTHVRRNSVLLSFLNYSRQTRQALDKMLLFWISFILCSQIVCATEFQPNFDYRQYSSVNMETFEVFYRTFKDYNYTVTSMTANSESYNNIINTTNEEIKINVHSNSLDCPLCFFRQTSAHFWCLMIIQASDKEFYEVFPKRMCIYIKDIGPYNMGYVLNELETSNSKIKQQNQLFAQIKAKINTMHYQVYQYVDYLYKVGQYSSEIDKKYLALSDLRNQLCFEIDQTCKNNEKLIDKLNAEITNVARMFNRIDLATASFCSNNSETRNINNFMKLVEECKLYLKNHGIIIPESRDEIRDLYLKYVNKELKVIQERAD